MELGRTLLLAALVVAAAIASAGRRRGILALFSTAALVQVGFHVVLSAGHSPLAHGAATPSGVLPGAWMIAAHAVGAVFVAAVLARGDATIFGLARLARRWVLMPPPPSRLTPRRAGPAVDGVSHRRPGALLLAAQLRYRGPPVEAMA